MKNSSYNIADIFLFSVAVFCFLILFSVVILSISDAKQNQQIEICLKQGFEWRDDGSHAPYCHYGDEQ